MKNQEAMIQATQALNIIGTRARLSRPIENFFMLRTKKNIEKIIARIRKK